MQISSYRNADEVLPRADLRSNQQDIIGHTSHTLRNGLIDVHKTAANLPVDNFIDYYQLLHVQPSAPAPVIKASYRAMMQKLNHHPDRGGDIEFAQLLNKAADTLCDPQTRAHYDLLRQQAASARQDKASNTQDDATEFCWGEPGGSPAGTNRQQSTGQAQAERDTASGNQADKSTGQVDPGSRETLGTNQVALPSRPHCLFCRASCPATTAGQLANNNTYASTRRCRVCNGATTPIELVPHSSNEELRRMHRHHHDCDASLWLQWPSSIAERSALDDFSPSGCALLFDGPIDTGNIVMIETAIFNAICSVRHCKPTGNGLFRIGLEFVTLDKLALPGALLNASA